MALLYADYNAKSATHTSSQLS